MKLNDEQVETIVECIQMIAEAAIHNDKYRHSDNIDMAMRNTKNEVIAILSGIKF